MIDIEKYRGLQYVDHGRDMSGVDCWGLIYLIYKNELGIEIPAWSAEYQTANKLPISEILSKKYCMDRWEKSLKPFVGAIGLFEIGGNFHVGVCLDKRGRNMLHIMKGTQSTIENIIGISWKNRFRGRWKYDAS